MLNGDSFFYLLKEEIIKPQIDGTTKKMSLTGTNEVFNLDVVEYKFASTAEDYLSEDFDHHYKYPLHCFVFVPLRQVPKLLSVMKFQMY